MFLRPHIYDLGFILRYLIKWPHLKNTAQIILEFLTILVCLIFFSECTLLSGVLHTCSFSLCIHTHIFGDICVSHETFGCYNCLSEVKSLFYIYWHYLSVLSYLLYQYKLEYINFKIFVIINFITSLIYIHIWVK